MNGSLSSSEWCLVQDLDVSGDALFVLEWRHETVAEIREI